MKPIMFTAHARGYEMRRGFTFEEVVEAIRTEAWTPADRGRLECRKNFAINGTWNGTAYTTKQVRPVFVDEPEQIYVITVYTYYF